MLADSFLIYPCSTRRATLAFLWIWVSGHLSNLSPILSPLRFELLTLWQLLREISDFENAKMVVFIN